MRKVGDILHERPVSTEHRIDGLHRWGIVELPDAAQTVRSGVARYRLSLFPPGTNAEEVRPLIFLRRWRGYGLAGAISLEIIAGAVWPGWTTALLIAGVYLAGLVPALRTTARLRAGTRRMNVAVMNVADDREGQQRLVLLSRLVRALMALDTEFAAGGIDLVDYEARWGAMYDDLFSERPAGRSGSVTPR
jgi:hypothetical protein